MGIKMTEKNKKFCGVISTQNKVYFLEDITSFTKDSTAFFRGQIILTNMTTPYLADKDTITITSKHIIDVLILEQTEENLESVKNRAKQYSDNSKFQHEYFKSIKKFTERTTKEMDRGDEWKNDI